MWESYFHGVECYSPMTLRAAPPWLSAGPPAGSGWPSHRPFWKVPEGLGPSSRGPGFRPLRDWDSVLSGTGLVLKRSPNPGPTRARRAPGGSHREHGRVRRLPSVVSGSSTLGRAEMCIMLERLPSRSLLQGHFSHIILSYACIFPSCIFFCMSAEIVLSVIT